MAEFKGRAKCPISGDDIDVYTDKNGLAYYKCGPTGIKVMHTIKHKSDAWLAEIFPEKPASQEPPKKTGFFDGVLA